MPSQEGNDGRLHSVAHHSPALRDAELSYNVHDKELLAVMDAFKVWQHYLIGSPHETSFHCDHRNLQQWTSERDLNGRQARWARFPAPFLFRIAYLAGTC